MGSRSDFEEKVRRLTTSVRQHLATDVGITLEEASPTQIYFSFAKAVRDRVMSNWVATREEETQRNAKMIYYISAEYMMGRALSNNLINMNMAPVARAAMDRLDIDPNEIERAEPDPGLGNGGLGRLAACFLDSMATRKLPAMGYGLRYQYGIFRQQIRANMQWEGPDGWLGDTYPWEIKRSNRWLDVKFGGRVVTTQDASGRSVETLVDYDLVKAIPYDVPIVGYDASGMNFINTLRLWSAAADPSNFLLHFYNEGDTGRALENLSITNVLYPKDNHEKGKWLRLKQEYFLVSATIQDVLRRCHRLGQPIEDLPSFAAIHINDTHPALAVAELMLRLTTDEGLSWEAAWDLTRRSCAYTNHTILAEALEKWDVRMFRALLPRQYTIVERINQEFCDTVRFHAPDDELRVRRMSIIQDGVVHMARLAIVGSHSVNGVAELHTKILRERELRDFASLWPTRFRNITNGVTPRRWLLQANPELADFITQRVGDGWITDFPQVAGLARFAEDRDSQDRFLEIKHRRKAILADYINRFNPHRDEAGNPGRLVTVDPASLFDVQVKRLHEYKRQLMNGLQILMTYDELRRTPGLKRVPRTFIFGAKAPTGYRMAKAIITFLTVVARHLDEDEELGGRLRVVFLENYNVSLGELVFPAADLSEQISTASQEASGTGNMKFAINGALTVGTDDGANVEMRQAIGDDHWPFLFGASSDQAIELMSGGYNPGAIIEANPAVARVLGWLSDDTLARTALEREALDIVAQGLLHGFEGSPPDRFLVLHDLMAYHATQKRVDELFLDRRAWARECIHNIAGMGRFSSDVSIGTYAEDVWGVEPLPLGRGKIEAAARHLGLDDSIYTMD